MYVDPEKARQERERQERERQAKLKAERDRQARIKAEQERQAKLKAERDRKARLKAEQERQANLKAEQKASDKKPTVAQKATEPKQDPNPPKSEKKPAHTPTPLLVKVPAPDPQPQTFLDRKARPWKDETPDPTPEQKRLLKVQQSEQASQAIWKTIPADKANLTLDYKKHLPTGVATNLTQNNHPPSYYDQWQNAAQKQIGPGDPKGIEKYFNENRKSLKTLDWLLQTNLNPALQDQNPELNITRAAGRGAYTDRTNYYKSEYQDYLTPAKDPTRERVQLTALKKGTLEQLTGKAPTNGVEIVRQIITKDEKGQPQSTFYTKSKDGWVPLSGIKPEQIIVTVNAPQTDGQQPSTLGSTVNIAGAEQHTRKQYNTINQNYQTYINPTFTQYQQLRGDTPRQLSGSNLRNEIGVAMNFTPNNAPLSETDQKALKDGKWDLFSPDKISPELAQSMSPAQQEKLKSQLKEQHEALTKIEGKVKEIGGDNAKVTTLPIMVDSPDIGGVMQVPLFRVAGKDGKDRFIDNTGRTYDNFQDWKDNNKLPAGRVSYFAEGQISSNKDGKPNIVTEKTHAVIDTPWEHIKQVGDWVATGVGVAVGVVAIGALILGTGGLATPLVVAGAGAALWGAGSAAGKLHDRSSHGESLSLADAEARSAWIELAANGVGFAAIGSSIRAGGAISKVMSTADEAGMLTASARQVNQASNLARTSQVLNGASSATDGVALADSTYGLAKGWDKLSPEQRLMAIGQIGFWGGMMAHGSREAMGNNFYASKDVDAFMHGVAAKPKENLTNPNLGDGVIPGQTRDEKIAQLREQTSSGRTKEELQARLIELKRQQQEGGTKAGDQKPNSEMVPTKPIDKETQPGTTPTQDKKTSTPKKQVTPEPALQQRTSNLDSLYKDATVAQAELDKVTRLVSQMVGGEPLIPPSLKGRDRTQQKIETDYGGDASRITDLARSSIICDNPQQIYKALGELKGQGHVVRVKDRFEKPVNGYRDMLVNVEMSNGHIVEVQLHLRSVMEVKNGVGHKLYEQVRTIEAQAKQEGRALTPEEAMQVRDLNGQARVAYDEAYRKATTTGVEKPGETKDGGIMSKMDASGYERTYPSATNKPRGLNMTLEEVRQRYGENGVTTVERTEQRAKEIIDHHAAELARKKGQGNVPNPGPVLSGITDPVTGQTYFGQNFKRGELKNEVFANFQDQLHPILKQRLKNHKQELIENNVKVENLASIDIAGQPGGHSEIRALDEAIKAREQYTGEGITEADLDSFLLHNRSLKDSVDVPPRCVHCWHLTDGVKVIGND